MRGCTAPICGATYATAAEEGRPPTREALRHLIEKHNGGISAAAAAMAHEVAARRQQVPWHGSSTAGQGAVLKPPKPRGSDTYWLFQPIYEKVHAGCSCGMHACVALQGVCSSELAQLLQQCLNGWSKATSSDMPACSIPPPFVWVIYADPPQTPLLVQEYTESITPTHLPPQNASTCCCRHSALLLPITQGYAAVLCLPSNPPCGTCMRWLVLGC